MDDKVLIKSEQDKEGLYTIVIIALIIGTLLSCFIFSKSRIHSVASEKGIVALSPFFIAIIFSVVVILWLRKEELIVTDKKVYGKVAFGKRVDLPIDSISAVSTSLLKGIAVGTSSGKISFKLINNRDEIHSLISKLIMERQKEEKTKTKIVTQQPNSTNADELKKYKELLDSGTITQEEFDAKKKQLLGL